MSTTLIREKLEQATRLVAHSDMDAWIVFDRETAGGGDPILPFILDGGLTWQSALIVTHGGRRVAIVGNYDADPIRASELWDEVIPYVQSIREPLRDALERLIPAAPGGRPPKLGVNFSTSDDKADGLTHGMYLALEEHLAETRFAGSLVSAEPIVSSLRGRKTAGEIARLKDAIAEGDRIFNEVAQFAQIGVSERAIYDRIHATMAARHLGFGWDPASDPIVNSGPESMIGHGLPSERITLQPGHIFHIDLGVIRDGYSSDIQRSWYVPGAGETAPPADVLRAFDAVHAAITAGAEALRVRVPGWKVDEAARASLTAAGYPEFMHALGHQVGRLAHDGGGILGPRWERYGATPFMQIEPDQVYTLELGVTLEGRGYLGLEEMVVVREAGLEWLSRRQMEMPLIGRRTV